MMVEWVEKLPAPVRHVVAAFIGAYVAVIIAAVSGAGGVTAVDWDGTLVDGLNKAALAAVAVVGTLFVTPLTDAYGVGKAPAVLTDADVIPTAPAVPVADVPAVPVADPVDTETVDEPLTAADIGEFS